MKSAERCLVILTFLKQNPKSKVSFLCGTMIMAYGLDMLMQWKRAVLVLTLEFCITLDPYSTSSLSSCVNAVQILLLLKRTLYLSKDSLFISPSKLSLC